MTTHKTFKQRVRARSAKTGESYSAARAQLLRKSDAPTAAPVEDPPIHAVELTGVTEDAMRRRTGRSIEEWIAILDAWGAREHSHTDIARWLVAEYGISGWWSQSVTVGYERARGIRVRHQDPGGFSVSSSRTIKAPAERISDAFTDASLLARWFPDAPIRLRTANRGRSARFDWTDPPSLFGFNLYPKAGDKTQLGLGHEKLPDAGTAARIKAVWRERLAALKELLETG